jgi:type IV secretory pathway VirD2 relaxase
VLAGRDRYAAFPHRRVIVKFSFAKMAGRGKDAARAHMRYIQRDGVTKEGERGTLYSAEHDHAEGTAFTARAEAADDRHQFRFIVSPEDGALYDDLKPLTRRLMTQMETDLDTKLDWVAVDHHNTGHPHTHIIVRGRDEHGNDLVIAREYLTHGIRERAAELVSLDLGPRTDLEVETRLRAEMEQERLTNIDRRLLRDMAPDRTVLSDAPEAFQQSLRAGRLKKLGRLGLAQEMAPGRWRLTPDFEETLRRMGERGDIIRTLQRAIAESGLARGASDYAIYDPTSPGNQAIVGRLVERGLSDEWLDRHYLIIDGLDGRTHYVDVGRESMTAIPAGAIVQIDQRVAAPRPMDHTIAEIAAAHGGRYSIDTHLKHDPSATADFAETHLRRLEAMRRGRAGVEREADGTWVIAADHLDRVAAFEQKRVAAAPVAVQALTVLSLDQQVGAEGATWLDRRLLSDESGSHDFGFGHEVREAQARRRQWLISEELAQERNGAVTYRPDMLAELRKRDLARAGTLLSGELGLGYVESNDGARIDGIYRRAIDLASGRFAVIEKSREFTLVPWRPVLDRHLGKQVSGIMRADSINWTLGRQRSGPSVG